MMALLAMALYGLAAVLMGAVCVALCLTQERDARTAGRAARRRPRPRVARFPPRLRSLWWRP